MSLDSIRRRLDKIEARNRTGKSGLGRYPAVCIITRSKEDRDQQVAALIAAGAYHPELLLIDRRIVSPDPRMKEVDDELRRHRPPLTAH